MQMSDKVIDKTLELKKLIIESDEYQKYSLYKEEIDQQPELRKKLQEFRLKNFELQLEGKSENKERILRFLDESREILENPQTMAYLNSELALCKKLQSVYKLLNDGIDLELDFL